MMGDSTIISVHIFNETLPRVDEFYTTLLSNISLLWQREKQFPFVKNPDHEDKIPGNLLNKIANPE